MNKFGMLVALCAAVAWGYVYATKDNLVQSMSPLSLMASFYLTGAVIFLPVACINRADILQGVGGNLGEFATAIVGILVAEICIIWSISLLGGTEAGLVEVSYPIWTALALYVFHGKVPSQSTMIGGALVMAGIAFIAINHNTSKTDTTTVTETKE